MKFDKWVEKKILEAKSMTYGTIPSFSDFSMHFRKEVNDELYNYDLKGSEAVVARKVKIPTSGDFTAKQLYMIVKKLVQAWEVGNDEAGDLASSIMYTLGYEWI